MSPEAIGIKTVQLNAVSDKLGFVSIAFEHVKLNGLQVSPRHSKGGLYLVVPRFQPGARRDIYILSEDAKLAIHPLVSELWLRARDAVAVGGYPQSVDWVAP